MQTNIPRDRAIDYSSVQLNYTLFFRACFIRTPRLRLTWRTYKNRILFVLFLSSLECSMKTRRVVSDVLDYILLGLSNHLKCCQTSFILSIKCKMILHLYSRLFVISSLFSCFVQACFIYYSAAEVKNNRTHLVNQKISPHENADIILPSTWNLWESGKCIRKVLHFRMEKSDDRRF